MAIDLHLHTHASDGTLSPQALLTAAAELGLTAVAITDHDATGALTVGAAVAAELGLTFIPGVEVSASFTPDLSLHFLGYGINPDHPRLRRVLAHNQKAWDQNEEDSIAALEKLAIKIDRQRYGYWKAHPEAGGWPLFQTLKEMGLIRDVNEYFSKYFGVGCPAYVTSSFISPEEAISTIKAAGGVPILAHPGLYFEDNQKLMTSPAFRQTLLSWGIEGLEAIANSHTPEETAFYCEFCQSHHLLITGGSDYHGDFAGRQLGRPVVDDAYLPPLLAAIARRQLTTAKR
ncbi:MAG TPA: PHP domain-containing protein [Firmicutes bacterium]|jgi:predicted metal-dependent phosphoesterase TrpH|nr:PHP domain-containing protein [Bacillota bacterium]